jgi:glucans biosynthesis protein C
MLNLLANATTTTTTVPLPKRQYYLDWLRIIAFALLIPYHVGMYYVSWDWHIKSPQLLTALEPWMRMLSPWRMDLLFAVSGAATAHMLVSRTADGSWLRQRAQRLLWPLLFGVLVIVPPQSYLEVVQRHDYSGSYFNFMSLYLTGYAGFCRAPGQCLILPTWNHLWYLPYLFVYTVVFWLIARWNSNWLENLAAASTRWLGPVGLIVWPLIFLATTRLLLRGRFPITHALADDWFAHSQYFFMFMFGAVLARCPALAARADAVRWPTLLLALLAWSLAVLSPTATTQAWGAIASPLLFSTQQWAAILAALGFAHRWLNVDARARCYLNDAVFPLYLLHQTLTILLAQAMLRWALPRLSEAALLTIATFALGFLGVELVRRAVWLRPWFGFKRVDPPISLRAVPQ